jgi:hypothetical protein
MNSMLVLHSCNRWKGGHGKTIWIDFTGRMGNNLIQYFHSRLLADKMGMGLAYNRAASLNWQLGSFPNIQFSPAAGGSFVKLQDTCGDSEHSKGIYKQNYLFYRHSRQTFRCLLQPSEFLKAKLPVIGSRDVVIHYRNGTGETRNHPWDTTVPTLHYLIYLLEILEHETGMSTIHFLSDPRFRKDHHVVDGLRAKFRNRLLVSQGSPEVDMLIGLRAPILIASTETFSWIMAYATTARRIYLVYESKLPRGAKHCPLHTLFIHDDPRIMYFDVGNTTMPQNVGRKHAVHLETAQEVLNRNTTFSHSVLQRKNSCKGML